MECNKWTAITDNTKPLRVLFCVAALEEGDEADDDEDTSPALDERDSTAAAAYRGSGGGRGEGRGGGSGTDAKARPAPAEAPDTVWIGR